MQTRHFLTLLLLAAIWGAAFLFMRIVAPVLGPGQLVTSRMLLSALFLAAVCLALKKPAPQRRDWGHYLLLGLLSSVLPFLLYAYAATRLSASLLSILNATAPLWGAVITAVWTRKGLAGKKILGMGLGIAGVSILVGLDPHALQSGNGFAIVAAISAALCYGIATLYMNIGRAIDPFTNAQGSAWGATLLVAPTLLLFPAPGALTMQVTFATLALGIVCSGFAFLLYFRLAAEIGPTSTLTVAFLIPLFGILWGALFLGEAIGWHTLWGTLTVLVGTALVTGFSPRRIFTNLRR
ncbi:MAG TPA: DMT family transporter [Rhodocyclaceae bacterium]|nr:DMT family transporter [Rhodocyclaceae bacterium]